MGSGDRVMVADKAAGKYVIARVSTGIGGLDELLYGGFPEGTQNLLMGDAGSGKTLLALQIVYNNAKRGIPSTYVSTEQTMHDLVKNFNSAFPNLEGIETLISKHLINMSERFMDSEIKGPGNTTLFIPEILSDTRANNSKLLVIDSLSMLRSLLESDRNFTRIINFMTENLHNMELTSITLIETPEEVTPKVPGLYDESMFDGILRIRNRKKGSKIEHIGSVVKLRYSEYKSTQASLQITPNGIVMRGMQSEL